MLVSILRMKIAYYHLIGKKVKVILATYNTSTSQLRLDMEKKFKLKSFLDRFKIEFEPKTIKDLSNGMFPFLIHVIPKLKIPFFPEWNFPFDFDSPASENLKNMIEHITSESIKHVVLIDEL